MSHKRTYAVEPQCSTGLGWTMCSAEVAERFALVELTHWKQGGKGKKPRQFRKHRILEVFPTEAAANRALAHALRRK